MQIDSGWVSAVVGALMAGGAAGTWLQKRRDEQRANLPLFRTVWRDQPEGWSASIEIVNRLDEDLRVIQADAKAKFFNKKVKSLMGGRVIVPQEYELIMLDQTILLDFMIEARGTRKLFLQVSGVDTPRWLSLTISSSLKTIRCKRRIIEDKPKL